MKISTDPYETRKAIEFAEGVVGKTVTAIHLSENRLTLDTTDGLISWRVEGDCCSFSYFHDLTGVEHLLTNGTITGFEPVDLQPGDVGYHRDDCDGDGCRRESLCGESHDFLRVYGYRFATEHPKFGTVSTVIAFRNDSNGYYGGWMEREAEGRIDDKQKPITADVIGPIYDDE